MYVLDMPKLEQISPTETQPDRSPHESDLTYRAATTTGDGGAWSHRSAGSTLAQRILVVEDDPIVSSLTPAGYEVTTVEPAFGGAGLVRDLQPAAILLDLGSHLDLAPISLMN